MLLAHAARFLASRGKGVVALDFDFEAPGLHYMCGMGRATAGGVVPYLIATLGGAASPPSLDDHMVAAYVPAGAEGWVRLMPAGPAPHRSYWAALKELGDRLRLTDLSGRGFMAVLDLQARIAEELNPDYLLIDARAGVSEWGSLATTVLADTVVCMFVSDQESLDGTLTVVEALSAAPRLANRKPIRVVPVLSRTTAEVSRDARFASGIMKLFQLCQGARGQGPNATMLYGLPHGDAMETAEMLVGGEGKTRELSSLYKAYLVLFQGLFPGLTAG